MKKLFALLLLVAIIATSFASCFSFSEPDNDVSDGTGTPPSDDNGGNNGGDVTPPSDDSGSNGDDGSSDGSESPAYPEGSVVWVPGTTVHIIPAEGVDRSSLAPLRDALEEMLGDAKLSSYYAYEQEYEITIGYVGDRANSVMAYKLLDRMEKDSYFNANYVIYAKNNKVAIAYDQNEYTTIQAYTYAVEYFIENYLQGKEYVAFGSGNRIERYVDLIEKQQELDDIDKAKAWDNLFIVAG